MRGSDSAQSQAPIGRPIPVVGSDREDSGAQVPANAPDARYISGCAPPRVDRDVPQEYMKILSRTVYVGGITQDISKEEVRDLFENVARVDSVTVNYPKFNAFVKLLTRAEADLIREKFNKFMFKGSMLKMGWGCGYGPKEFFDYSTGETLFPLVRMTDSDKRHISATTRGGGPIQGGTVVEEPDVNFPQRGDSIRGSYVNGQPFRPPLVPHPAMMQNAGRGTFTGMGRGAGGGAGGAGMGRGMGMVQMGGMGRPNMTAHINPGIAKFPGNMQNAMGAHHQAQHHQAGYGHQDIMVAPERTYDDDVPGEFGYAHLEQGGRGRGGNGRGRGRGGGGAYGGFGKVQAEDRGEEVLVVLGGGESDDDTARGDDAAMEDADDSGQAGAEKDGDDPSKDTPPSRRESTTSSNGHQGGRGGGYGHMQPPPHMGYNMPPPGMAPPWGPRGDFPPPNYGGPVPPYGGGGRHGGAPWAGAGGGHERWPPTPGPGMMGMRPPPGMGRGGPGGDRGGPKRPYEGSRDRDEDRGDGGDGDDRRQRSRWD
ncbi:hypothetical protein HDV00_000474 [Rhizophlyctis rosea]|nr:hypothetical protein HDV00_000474 [Rhizophlyctis rosea]